MNIKFVPVLLAFIFILSACGQVRETEQIPTFTPDIEVLESTADPTLQPTPEITFEIERANQANDNSLEEGPQTFNLEGTSLFIPPVLDRYQVKMDYKFEGQEESGSILIAGVFSINPDASKIELERTGIFVSDVSERVEYTKSEGQIFLFTEHTGCVLRKADEAQTLMNQLIDGADDLIGEAQRIRPDEVINGTESYVFAITRENFKPNSPTSIQFEELTIGRVYISKERMRVIRIYMEGVGFSNIHSQENVPQGKITHETNYFDLGAEFTLEPRENCQTAAQPPQAMDDLGYPIQGTAITLNVLGNDFGADHEELSIIAVSQGLSGTVTHDGKVATYTPNPDFLGVDMFTYVVSDGFYSDTAKVHVTTFPYAIEVDTTEDGIRINENCSLREAIQAANTDEEVDACVAGDGLDLIRLPAGIYAFNENAYPDDNNLVGDLDILGDLVIDAAGPETTIIDGSAVDRVLDIHFEARQVIIRNLAITNGQSGVTPGAGIQAKSNLYLENVNVFGNLTASRGGGLYVDFGRTTVVNGLVHDNVAQNGGGIAVNAGTLVMSHTQIISNALVTRPNSSGIGGGLFIDGDGRAALFEVAINNNAGDMRGGGIAVGPKVGGGKLPVLIMHGGEILNNTVGRGEAGVAGGGHFPEGHRVVLSGTLIMNNSARYGAGGLYIGGQAILTNTQIISNAAGLNGAFGSGGGLVVYGQKASVFMSNTLVQGNTSEAEGGGGISLYGGAKATLNNTRIIKNTAPSGGGISAANTLNIIGGEISHNTASLGGGGLIFGLDVFSSEGATLNIRGTKIAHNFGAGGGGLALYGDAVVINAEITNNSAEFVGGGLTAGDNSRLQLVDSKIISNTSNEMGGGMHIRGGTLVMSNTQILNNEAVTSIAGGILSEFSTITDQGSEIRGNIGSQGGGIYAGLDSTINLRDTKIADNNATLRGGGLAIHTSNLNLADVIIRGNQAVNGGSAIIQFADSTITTLTPLTIIGDFMQWGGTFNGVDYSLTIDGDLYIENADALFEAPADFTLTGTLTQRQGTFRQTE